MQYEEKIKAVFKNCANILGLTDEEQLSNLVLSFKDIQPKKTIKILTQKCLEKFKDSNNAKFKEFLNEIFKLNDGSFASQQEVVELIKREKQEALRINHEIVNESLKEVCTKFNELGIDYYIVGALPVYLQAGQMTRMHEDIDFFVAEKDLPKVAQVLATTQYSFHDYRLNSPRVHDENGKSLCGDHEVVADRTDSPFHLGFFLFKREKDGSVTQREYQARIDKQGIKVPELFQRKMSKETFEYNYGVEPVKYLNTEFRASTAESVYDIKKSLLESHFRPKDAEDVSAWESAKKAGTENPLIDPVRLEKMRNIAKENPMPPPSRQDLTAELIEEIKKQQELMNGCEQPPEQNSAEC